MGIGDESPPVPAGRKPRPTPASPGPAVRPSVPAAGRPRAPSSAAARRTSTTTSAAKPTVPPGPSRRLAPAANPARQASTGTHAAPADQRRAAQSSTPSGPASRQASAAAATPPSASAPQRRSSVSQPGTHEAPNARTLKPPPPRPKATFDAAFNDGSSPAAASSPGSLRQSTTLSAHRSAVEEALSSNRSAGQNVRESSVAQQQGSLAKAAGWEEQGGRGYASQAADAMRGMIGRRKPSVVGAEAAQADVQTGLNEIRNSVFEGGQRPLEQGEGAQLAKRRVSQASRVGEAGAFVSGHPEIAAAIGGASALTEATLDGATAQRRHQAATGFDQALQADDLAPNSSDPLAHATRAAAESQMHKAAAGISEAVKDAALDVVNAAIAGTGADVAAHVVTNAPGVIKETQSFLGGTATTMADQSQKVVPENKHIPDQGIRETLANELQGAVVGAVQGKLMASTRKLADDARGKAAVRIKDIAVIKKAQESAAQRSATANTDAPKGMLEQTSPADIKANRRGAVALQRGRRASLSASEHEHHGSGGGAGGGGSPRPRSGTKI